MKRAKNFFELVWFLIEKNILLTIALLIGVAFSFYNWYPQADHSDQEMYIVQLGTLDKEVSLTGTVKPAEEAELSFEKGGVVKNIFVVSGERVKTGDVLASLSADDDSVKVLEARANLVSMQAQLQDLQSGSKEETVAIKQASLEKAQNDMRQSYTNAKDTLKNLSNNGNTFVKNNLAKYFDGSYQTDYRINIPSCDSKKESELANLRKSAEKAVNSLSATINTYSDLDTVSQKTLLNNILNNEVVVVSNYLNTWAEILNQACISTDTSFDADRNLLITSKNTWVSLTNYLSQKINVINTANLSVLQAEKDLLLAKSGEKSEKVRQQEAQVRAAQARLEATQILANKNILRAPFNGIITNINLKKGEFTQTGMSGISLISDSNFLIESKVSEIDVAKIAIGSIAQVTFDAYGDNKIFEAIISNISPAGIISEGVPTYKTIFDFLQNDSRIRSGMTANISVSTQKLDNVVAIPAKYIQSEAGQKYVKKIVGRGYEKTTIKTGSIGVDGKVEIVEGVKVGDVLIYEK